MIKILTFFLVLLGIHCERVMYFHYGAEQYPKQMNLKGIRNNPVYRVYDCSKYDCDRFVKTQYPALFYWKGPGSAFQKIPQHTEEAVRAHFAAKQIGYVNKFRRWLQEISLFQTFICAILVAGGLFYVFTLLFSPPQHKRSHHHGHNKKKEDN